MTARIPFILALLLANLSLLIPGIRPIGAVLLTLLLPGWHWAGLLLSQPTSTENPSNSKQINLTSQLGLSLGFSIAWTSLIALGLHYLPGPIHLWQLLLALNLIALIPLFRHPQTPLPLHIPAPLLFILMLSALLRFTNLPYSEFQGDEALAMIFAAEAIEGHEDALFLRGKGPGEILLPLALWRINGPITEAGARIPFALAGLGAIMVVYLLAKDWFSEWVGLFAAGLFAASGFMVGFSRIVQYQTIVVLMSLLAAWSLWRWQQEQRLRWAAASGLFVGIGLLAHYDAVLVIPVLAWLFWQNRHSGTSATLKSAGIWVAACLGSTLPFYVPYYLDPQFSSTSSYLGDRIGEGVLKNHLQAFLHFNSFYSSFYYTLVMGLLLIGFVAWALHRATWGRVWGPIVAVLGFVGLTIWPNALGTWAAIPFALLLLGVFLSDALTLPLRLALIWFTVPFLGYNFAVARPLTHIYTVIPGWALLAGWALAKIPLHRNLLLALYASLILIFSGYLWNAFIRHELSLVFNYPASKPAFYLTPYEGTPETGFFGFPHRTGWKGIGALIADGTLSGDYDSNEEEDISSWYTRHAPRACDSGAEFYFMATDLVDPVPVPTDLLTTDYAQIAAVRQTGDTLFIHQRRPNRLDLGTLSEAELAGRFDATAYPSAFARTPRWQVGTDANFGGQVRLLGYSLDTNRAYPGGRIVLTLFWQQLTQMEQSYKIFVQLDPDKKFAQADSVPSCARYPTNLWRPHQVIADQHALHLSLDTPPGPHSLVVGLYLPEDGRRLDILDVAGNPAGVSLTLTDVAVGERP